MTIRFPHLHAAIVQHPWAITPDRLQAIAEVVERRAEGIRLSASEIAALKGEREPNGVATLFSATTLDQVGVVGQQISVLGRGEGGSPAPVASVIAVISVFGIIAQHASEVDDISGPGGTSTERVMRSFRNALGDASVKAIVLRFNSPGGNVHGVQVLANEIFKARGQKPIIAQVDSLAASAAYWIASACDEIVVTPGGQVGSIGVYGLHRDVSKAAEAQGVKFTFVSAGKYKVEGNQYEPLTDEATQALQAQIDDYYRDFTTDVARGRGVKVSDVVGGFGEGRVEKDRVAVKLGMADRVATLDETLRRVASMKTSSGPRADHDTILHATADATEPDAPPSPPVDNPSGLQVSGNLLDASAPSATESDRDAFRRRRHAHRSRNG